MVMVARLPGEYSYISEKKRKTKHRFTRFTMFYPPPKKKQTKLKTVAVKRTSSEVLKGDSTDICNRL